MVCALLLRVRFVSEALPAVRTEGSARAGGEELRLGPPAVSGGRTGELGTGGGAIAYEVAHALPGRVRLRLKAVGSEHGPALARAFGAIRPVRPGGGRLRGRHGIHCFRFHRGAKSSQLAETVASFAPPGSKYRGFSPSGVGSSFSSARFII